MMKQPSIENCDEGAPSDTSSTSTGPAHGVHPVKEPEASQPEPSRGVYGISVAAELVGMGTQTLRLYEARGLLEPERTPGGTRRYSPNDLDRVRRIGALLTDGLNLAGIAMVLDLEEQNTHLRTINQEHLVPETDRLDQTTPTDPAEEKEPSP